MFQNLSPWLHQLQRLRPVLKLHRNAETDVAIVGGGISGIITAYFVLRDTSKKVILVEANKVANGATGHNAGQIVSYFEKPFTKIVEEYGLHLAVKAQDDILSGWEILEEIYSEAKLLTPVAQFTGYAGCPDLKTLLIHLENKRLRAKMHIRVESVLVAEEAPFLKDIPSEYKNLYAVVPQKDILELLESNNTEYMAALTSRKGCLNSALFCEELVGYLLKTYPKRFRLIEHTPIAKVSLYKNYGVLHAGKYLLKAKRIVLCTNGFENISLENLAGRDIDHTFHELVEGLVGYMAGYLEPYNHPPTAITYFSSSSKENSDPFSSDPYCYMTRRAFELEKNEKHNLVCMGGHEMQLEDKTVYNRHHEFPKEAEVKLKELVQKNYKHAPQEMNFKYRWHGLMGYTKNGLRCIGPEPKNPVLLYNLGCNGIGILPSLFGGKRISLFLKFRKLERSIFDPAHE